jgi:hypothetical protein
MAQPSDYIVFVDESGTPVTHKPDLGYPIFSLQFVLVRKDVYSHQIVPELISFKMKHHGSDATILHGKKIDAKDGEFRILQDSAVFHEYVSDLDQIIGKAQMQLFSAYFLHHEVASLSSITVHPYAYFMHVLLNEIEAKIAKDGVKTVCRVVVESRKASDAEMQAAYESYKLAFRSDRVEFELEFAEKSRNVLGLQVADLVAKPIARYCLDSTKPGQEWPTVSTKVSCMLNLSADVPFRLGTSTLL